MLFNETLLSLCATFAMATYSYTQLIIVGLCVRVWGNKKVLEPFNLPFYHSTKMSSMDQYGETAVESVVLEFSNSGSAFFCKFTILF